MAPMTRCERKIRGSGTPPKMTSEPPEATDLKWISGLTQKGHFVSRCLDNGSLLCESSYEKACCISACNHMSRLILSGAETSLLIFCSAGARDGKSPEQLLVVWIHPENALVQWLLSSPSLSVQPTYKHCLKLQ